MGIVNMTPDSFYDGGRFSVSLPQALDRCAQLIDDGATILDIGGESTRPGAEQISIDEELSRVIPLIEALSHRFETLLSIDTTKSQVAETAINAGAKIVNDVSSGRFDLEMPKVIAQSDVTVVLMHSRKTPQNMQDAPTYSDVVAEVISELSESIDLFIRAGVVHHNIIVDPGFGFAKRLEDNLALLKKTNELKKLGYPLLIGTSRKSFIGAVTGKDTEERLAGSLATIGAAYASGASVFRVHDVAETVDYLKMIDAIQLGAGFELN